jgi:large subunit ribosomal protein L6
MSRIGKKPISIPEKIEIKIDGRIVFVKGPKGELSKEFRPEIEIKEENGQIFVSPKKGLESVKKIRAFWGLTRKLIANMVEGVTNGFEKRLQIEGIGYKAEVSGKELVLSVGFSHQVKLEIPEGLEASVEKNVIIISGIDKEKVGQFAAVIRKVRPAEPYKGKGIKYFGEIIRRKVGKKAAAVK